MKRFRTCWAANQANSRTFYENYENLFWRNKKILLILEFQAEQSLMTFEGTQIQGSAKIMEKIQSLTFQKIAHVITAVDCQPTFDGGILINVLGQLKVYIWISFNLDRNYCTTMARKRSIKIYFYVDWWRSTSWFHAHVCTQTWARFMVRSTWNFQNGTTWRLIRSYSIKI